MGRTYLASALLCLGVSSSACAFAAVNAGQAAPPLATETLAGSEFNLDAEKGKIVVLHFWATWCPACRKEMPALANIYRRFHTTEPGKGLDVIAVSVDRPRDREDVVKYMHAFPFPAAMAREAKANGFDSPGSIPVTYVIDSKGIIRAIYQAEQGELTEKALSDLIVQLANP